MKFVALLPIMFSVILLLFVFGCVNQKCTGPNCAPETKCNDSDSGKDILVKGTLEANGTKVNDSCVNSSTVKEYYCDQSAQSSFEERTCPVGLECSDGFCTTPPATCSDSDNGLNYTTSGKVTVGEAVSSDDCEGSKLREYYCENRTALSILYDCPNGFSCSNGKCSPKSCQDSEGQKSISIAGTVQIQNDSGNYSFQDSCKTQNTMLEYSCDGSTLINESINCPAGTICNSGLCGSDCSDSDGSGINEIYTKGAVEYNAKEYADVCVSNYTLTEYSCAGTSLSKSTLACPSDYICQDGRCNIVPCVDSDGNDPLIPGNVTDSVGTYYDSCMTEDALEEYTCVNNKAKLISVPCLNDHECVGGMCLPISCTDSDGNDPLTKGTVTSIFENRTRLFPDDCISPSQVYEFICVGARIKLTTASCSLGYMCSDGQCVVNCSETDSGYEDYGHKGTVYYVSTFDGTITPFTDYCKNDSTLVEYSCNLPYTGYRTNTEVNCLYANSCSDGICIY